MTSTPARIAAAAMDVLRTEGGEAVTMRRIGAEVGLSAMAIYRHFPNRDALLAHVADECFEEPAQRWRDFPRVEDPRERLYAGADRLVDFAPAEPRLYSFMVSETRRGARGSGGL